MLMLLLIFFAAYTAAVNHNVLYSGPDNPKNCPFPLGIWAPIQYMVPNGSSIGSAIFAGPTNVHYSVCNNMPHLAIAAAA